MGVSGPGLRSVVLSERAAGMEDERVYASELPESSIFVGFVAALSISVVGVVLNSLTLVTLCSSVKLRRHSTTHFVISLTVSDLLYCAFSLPMTADTFAGCGFCENPTLCGLYGFTFYWNVTVMMVNQAAVACNRYVLVCCTIKPVIKFTTRNNLMLISLVWVCPFAILLVPLTELWGSFGYDQGTGTCTFKEGDARTAFLVVGFVIPTIVIVFCYSRIYCTYKGSSLRIKANSSASSIEGPPSTVVIEQQQQQHTTTPAVIITKVSRRHSHETGSTVANNNILAKREDVSSCSGESSSGRLRIASPVHRSMPSGVDCISAADAVTLNDSSMAAAASSSHNNNNGVINISGARRIQWAVSVSQKEKEQRREKQENRITLTLFVIFLAFIFCTLPPFIILAIDPNAEKYPEWHVPMYIFGWAFGVVNPVVYVALNRTYREEYKLVLGRILTCAKCRESSTEAIHEL